jgi:5,10-methylenetetrahydromethanopterin reductase
MGISPREPVRRIGTLAATAEQRGFDALWVIDSHLVMADVYTALTVAAMNTSTLNLGTGVTNPYTRHVTVTANAIASIDDVSEGRAMLGVGSGDSSVQPLGIKPARIGELRSYLTDVRSLLRGDAIDGQGQTVTILRARPELPIFMAATQPGMLRLAAAVADGVVLLGFAHPEVIAWQIQHIEEGLDRAGRSWDDLTIDYWATISIRDDAAQALDDVRSWSAGQARWLHTWKEVPAVLQPFADEARAAAEEYDFSEHLSLRAKHTSTVSDDFVRTGAIAGDHAHCVERVRAIAATPHISRITLTLLSGGRDERLEALSGLIGAV